MKVKKDTELLSVRITKGDKHKLEEYAEENDLTVSQVIRKLIKTWVKTEEIKRNRRG